LDGEITITRYSCPHCHGPLETDQARWHGWVRCPKCGRPGLPPTAILLDRRSRPARLDRVNRPDKSVKTLDPPTVLARASLPPLQRMAPTPISSASRLIVTTGLVISAFLLLMAYLDRNTPSSASAIFGCLTVVFFLLLLRMPKRR
jgi:hypothetical protein